MKKEILEAVNEMEGTDFSKFDEIFDVYTYEEIVDIVLKYNGIIGYTSMITKLFETFYNMQEKTDKEI